MTFVCGGKVFEPVLEVDFVRITNLSVFEVHLCSIGLANQFIVQ